MERNQEEMWEPYVVEWGELLFEAFNYEEECKKLFPLNPPNARRCLKFIDILEDICALEYTEEDKGMIVVCDHGIGEGNLPLVYVIRDEGEKLALENFSHHDLLTMPILVETKEKMSKEQILILLCFYILYPLRVTRQKKRDSVAMLLNVMRQYAQGRK